MGTDQPIYNIAHIFFSLTVLSIIVWGGLKLDRADLTNRYALYLLLGILAIFIILPFALNKVNRVFLISKLFSGVYRSLAVITILSVIII